MKIEKERLRRTPRRIDTEVVKRIITILHDDGTERRTKISLKAHLSYDKCLLYLEWLELMGLIRKEKDANNFELINLTGKGNELYLRYSESSSRVL